MPLILLLHVQICLRKGLCVTGGDKSWQALCFGQALQNQWAGASATEGWRTKEQHCQPHSSGRWTYCLLHQTVCWGPCRELAWTSPWLQTRWHPLAASIMSKEPSVSSLRSKCQRWHRVVAASAFKKLWLELCPFIVVARPVTDLCWRCQQSNTNIYRSAIWPWRKRVSCFKNMQLILAKLMLSDSSTSGRLKRGRSVCVAMDWWHCSQHHPIHRNLQCTTPLTSPRRCIIQAMQLNQGWCISRQLGSVQSSVFRWITLLMSVSTAARAPVVSSATSTTFFKALALERRPSICIVTTVQGRTRTDMFYGISCGVWWGVFTPRWPWTSCQLVHKVGPGVVFWTAQATFQMSESLLLERPLWCCHWEHPSCHGQHSSACWEGRWNRACLHWQLADLPCTSLQTSTGHQEDCAFPILSWSSWRFSTRPAWQKKRAGWTFWRTETHSESLVPCQTSYLPLDCPQNDSSTYSARSGNLFGRTTGMWCAPTQATNLQPEIWMTTLTSGQFAWPVHLLTVLKFLLLLCLCLYYVVNFYYAAH